MKFTYNWLKEFVDIDVPVEQVAEALVSAGLEVASITARAIPPGVTVARVISRDKHPDADKLSLCSVDIGAGAPLAIVCGAPNVAAGMLVACATVGTRLAPDFVIKKARIRGQESFGMLCSEKELGISDDHSGIMSLPPEFVVGKPLREYLPDDQVIEVELTPNRGDCLSVVGIAREVAAAFGKPLKLAPIAVRESGGNIGDHIAVEIRDPARCPRYMGRLIRGVKIAPSPLWLKDRLTAAGLRPINNIVDITNYMLLEYGQPQHSFDYACIGGKKIIVQRASDGLKFETLDGQERALRADDLLICDAQRPVAIAGVMGGAGSMISDATTDVFLECAFFDPVGIRVTSRRLGLSTDSSYRFERGVDPLVGLERALDKAAQLMADLGGGAVVSGIVDAYPVKLPPKIISVRPSRAALVLGIPVSPERIEELLGRLGMACTARAGDLLTFTVPLHRHDITAEVDLIEEIGRCNGYDNVPAHEFARVSILQNLSVAERKMANLRHALAYFGLHETLSNSMTSERWRSAFTPDVEPVTVLNPLTPEMAQMRTTLLGSMLQNVAHNLNRRNLNNRFFELGKTYRKQPGKPLADERWVLAITIEGNWTPQSWNTQAQPVSYYVLKGIVEALASHARLEPFAFAAIDGAVTWFGGEAATVVSSSGVKGVMGVVSARALALFDIKSAVCHAELDVTDFLGREAVDPQYSQLPRFPALERDYCFVMAENVPACDMVAAIRATSPLVESVTPFDLYRGDKLGAGLKSLAFSVGLRSSEKTLSDREAEDVSQKIVAVMKERFSATLRS